MTAERIEALCAEFNACYIHHRNNVREKRNLGIELARSPVVLFVDSDCVLNPIMLLEHYQSYDNDSIAGVIGVTRFVGKSSQIWRIIAKTSFLDAFTYAERLEFAPWGPTCNISYRKDVLEAVGKFDTSFPFRLGGDDTDLGLRVIGSGYAIKCNPRAIVEHTRETWSGISLIGRRVFRWGRMHYHLMRKHPDRVFYDFPTVLGLFLLLLLVILPLAAIIRKPSLIVLPLVWLGMELLIETMLTCGLPGHHLHEFGYRLGARLLSLTFECGTLLEAFRHRSLQPFYREASYTPPSLEGRNRRIIQIWASVLTFLALILIGYAL